MYKYLLWDIDGTVLDFLASESYAIRTLFKKFHIGDCSDEMLRLYSQINVKYWQIVERNEMSKKEILVERFREFFESIGVDTTIAEDFNKAYQLTLGDYIEYVPGAKEMLLAQKGKYVIVGVTNGTKIAQTKKLKQSGLDEIFDYVFISEDVGYEKPDKRYFDYVFDKLNITDKREALIIGDSLTSDIQGGVNAGIDTCWYNPSHKSNSRDISVTYEIDNLKELDKIIKTN